MTRPAPPDTPGREGRGHLQPLEEQRDFLCLTRLPLPAGPSPGRALAGGGQRPPSRPPPPARWRPDTGGGGAGPGRAPAPSPAPAEAPRLVKTTPKRGSAFSVTKPRWPTRGTPAPRSRHRHNPGGPGRGPLGGRFQMSPGYKAFLGNPAKGQLPSATRLPSIPLEPAQPRREAAAFLSPVYKRVYRCCLSPHRSSEALPPCR